MEIYVQPWKYQDILDSQEFSTDCSLQKARFFFLSYSDV